MKTFFTKIFKSAFTRRLTVPSINWLTIVGLLVSLTVLSGLKFEYNIEQFLPQHSQDLKDEEKIETTFYLQKREPLILTVASTDTWLNSSKIQRLKKLTNVFSLHPSVEGIVSLSNIEGPYQNGENIGLGPLLETTPQDRWSQRISKDPLITPGLLSTDQKSTSLVIHLKSLPVRKINDTMTELKGIALTEFPKSEIHVGGTLAVQASLSQLLEDDLLRALIFSLLISTLTLSLIFTSYRTLIIPFVVGFSANVFTFAALHWMGFSFSLLSATAPVLLTVITMTMVTHTMIRFVELRSNFHSPLSAAVASLEDLFWPNLLTALTTIIGYLTLVPSDIPAISEYGTCVIIAVTVSFLVTYLLLPGLLSQSVNFHLRPWVKNLSISPSWIRRYSIYIVAATFLCVGFLYFNGQNLSWETHVIEGLSAQHPTQKASEFIDRQLGGSVPLHFSVSAPSATFWKDPSHLNNLNSWLNEWRSQEGIGQLVGLPDVLKSSGIDLQQSSKQSLAETLFIYSLSPDNPIRNYLSGDSKTTRISLRIKDMAASESTELSKKIFRSLSEQFPTHQVSMTGLGSYVHRLKADVSRDLMNSFWTALLAIGALLLVIFHSLRWTLVAILPNIIPPVVLLFCLTITQIPIRPEIAIVFCIALGMAFDNTVYMINRMRTSLSNGDADFVSYSLQIESRPILITNALVIAGMTVFLLSGFQVIRIFGGLMLVTMLTTLYCDLIFLPSFVHLTKKFFYRKGRFKMKWIPAGGLLVLLASASLVSPPAASRATKSPANQILDQVKENISAPQETSRISMTIIEADGSKKNRELKLKRKTGAEERVLVRISEPADLQGISFLTVNKSGTADQWIYLPSSKKTRRVISHNRSTNFLDSEFTYHDFSIETYNSFENRKIAEKKKGNHVYHLIESRAKDKDAPYAKILTWIEKSNHLILQAYYYNDQGQILKKMNFFGYKKLANKSVRASKVIVQNMRNKRKTILEFDEIDIKRSVANSDLTLAALEDE